MLVISTLSETVRGSSILTMEISIRGSMSETSHMVSATIYGEVGISITGNSIRASGRAREGGLESTNKYIRASTKMMSVVEWGFTSGPMDSFMKDSSRKISEMVMEK